MSIGNEERTADRHARALQLIQSNWMLLQAFELEPRLHDLLHEINALLVVERRDLAYSHFKVQCDGLVGFRAARPELRTSHHYVALLDLLDRLLSWVEEKPTLPLEQEIPCTAREDDLVQVAVRESLAASRLASLQAFRDLV